MTRYPEVTCPACGEVGRFGRLTEEAGQPAYVFHSQVEDGTGSSIHWRHWLTPEQAEPVRPLSDQTEKGKKTVPEDTPAESPKGVFLDLLDAYREANDFHIRNLYGIHSPLFDDVVARRRKEIDADCENWRARYTAAVARRLAAAPGDPLP